MPAHSPLRASAISWYTGTQAAAALYVPALHRHPAPTEPARRIPGQAREDHHEGGDRGPDARGGVHMPFDHRVAAGSLPTRGDGGLSRPTRHCPCRAGAVAVSLAPTSEARVSAARPGKDEELNQREWRTRAACRKYSPQMWWPEHADSCVPAWLLQ